MQTGTRTLAAALAGKPILREAQPAPDTDWFVRQRGHVAKARAKADAAIAAARGRETALRAEYDRDVEEVWFRLRRFPRSLASTRSGSASCAPPNED